MLVYVQMSDIILFAQGPKGTSSLCVFKYEMWPQIRRENQLVIYLYTLVVSEANKTYYSIDLKHTYYYWLKIILEGGIIVVADSKEIKFILQYKMLER